MSLWPLLLRVLLILSLILNGSAYAMASVHMVHGQVGAVAMSDHAPATASSTKGSPCHDHQAQPPTAATQHQGAAPVEAPSNPEPPAPDCCESGACQCACVHQVQAAMPMPALAAAKIEPAGSLRMSKSGHATPALPHLLRPPIG